MVMNVSIAQASHFLTVPVASVTTFLGIAAEAIAQPFFPIFFPSDTLPLTKTFLDDRQAKNASSFLIFYINFF